MVAVVYVCRIYTEMNARGVDCRLAEKEEKLEGKAAGRIYTVGRTWDSHSLAISKSA
jgi:hypothetical protein